MTASTDEFEFKFSAVGDHDFEVSTIDDHGYSRPELVAATSGINVGLGKRRTIGTRTKKGKKQSRVDCFTALNVDAKHLPRNIGLTPADRAKSYPSELCEFDGKLFCKLCNVVLDHNRIYCIKQHFMTKKHMSRADKFSQANNYSAKCQ